jgi:oxygen-independent coproporphyrinogen III oxidase
MKSLIQAGTKEELITLIEQEAIADYVYMYPPRQAYRDLGEKDISSLIASSLNNSDSINLYFHFPFCRQICAFCNLFTYVSTDEILFEKYIGYLERELLYYLPMIAGKAVRTIYLGGGTPSLLAPELFNRLFNFLQNNIRCDIGVIPEVAIEVSPETVDYNKLAAYKDAGINRINLGVQSLANNELHLIGRGYDSGTPYQILRVAQTVGFSNICVDLIYGLQDQTLESWKSTVDCLLDFGPETICAYALTLRPITGYDVRGYSSLPKREQYAKYDYANEKLISAGYKQETHVRWIKNEKGGYQQKANHWSLENILGIGAGARGYLWECDYRNGYSVQHRTQAFKSYLSNVDQRGQGIVEGYIMNDDERRRKAVVLGLENLHRGWFRNKFGIDPKDAFPEDFDVLLSLGLITEETTCFKLTPIGIRHRDVIVQRFFSPQVLNLLNSFDYRE